jgi:two-component system NtrC family sensor kinase
VARRSKAGDEAAKGGRRKAAAPGQAIPPKAMPGVRSARATAENETETARLSRERDEALERETAMAHVLRVISSSPGDLAPVFNAMVENALRLCEAEAGNLFLYNGEDFATAALQGASPAYAEARRRGVVVRHLNPDVPLNRVIRTKQVIHIVDAREERSYIDRDPRFCELVDDAGARTLLLVPMLKNDDLVGAFAIYRREVRPFGDKQIGLVTTFADQAVIAIENARLFNETKEALARQTAMADVLKVIASSPSDLEPVFEVIAERSNQLVGGHSTAVFRFNGDVVELAAATRLSEEADAWLRAAFPRPVSTMPGFEWIARGEIARTVDTEADGEPEISKAMARARGFRSRLMIPLTSDSGVMGAISVTRTEAGSFAENDIELLRTFADQAVIAIQNVELIEQVQARTRELQEALQQQTATADVLKAISRSAFDLQTVLDALLTSACQLCEADIGTIRYKDGISYRLAATYGCKPEWIKHLSGYSTKPDQSSVFGQTIIGGRTVHMPDVLADANFKRPEAQKLMGFRAVLGVPLVRDGHTFGVVNLFRFAVGSFEPKQIEVVETFADQAVIAIENVRLFGELQARTKELASSLDGLRAAQDRLVQTEKLASLGQLTAGIAHEIKNPLNFINNFSALSVELVDELNGALRPATLDDKIRVEVDELTGLLKDNLGKVVGHGKRADSIVKNMLLHSRESSGERQVVDINALVGESLNLAYHGARAEKSGFTITLQHDFDPRAGAAELYPQEITRALLNLISNGFYAATRRKVESVDDSFEPVLSASTRDLGTTVEIRIRDNGAGIPPDVKKKMFIPFFTTKPTGEGTGLGLSMTHDIIVKQHGGRIDVETEPGLFTELVITLPRDTRNMGGLKSE